MLGAGLIVVRVTPTGAITVVAGGLAAAAIALVATVLRGGHGKKIGAAGAVGALVAGGLLAWVGTNDPTVLWFGQVVTHGDRHGTQVAVTFDDGPDDPWTLEVARILDRYNVKGTFFEVGKALDARPAIARALYEDGHLLANHSHTHNYTSWLNPAYPELQQTQDAFRRNLGVCPAFFRPPHGQRTPFMLAQASRKGMDTVTWDTSVPDWAATDGSLVAKQILERVRPGSIIVLHDGLDGNVTANRSVMRTALPMVLDGLRARGLDPVRLDVLLGRPGYLPRC